MSVVNDYSCARCDRIAECPSDDIATCHGMEMVWFPRVVTNWEWGSPRYYLHLREKPFDSRSELNRFARDNGLSLGESSEKVGGARNDMYDGIGKSYSYSGASGRRNPLASLPGRQ